MSDGGAKTNIITYAFLFGDEDVAGKKEAKRCNEGIPLDGMEKNHDRMRRKGSFQKVHAGFRETQPGQYNGSSRNDSATISTSTILKRCTTWWTEKGVEIWQIQIVTSMGNMAVKNTRLSPGSGQGL